MNVTPVHRWPRTAVLAGIVGLTLVGATPSSGLAAPPSFTTTLQDVGSSAAVCGAVQANALTDTNVNTGGISTNGNLVAFVSDATNLVASDSNNASDVFVHDNTTNCTTRVSVDSAGTQGNGASYWAGISGNGQRVVFASDATNLVAGDTNGVSDVFVHDLGTGATIRASVDSLGVQGNAGSADPASFDDTVPMRGAITANGNEVAFPSNATNLVAGDTNTVADVFVRDIAAGTTVRVSTDSAGAEATDPNTSPTSPCQICPARGSYHAAISTTGAVVTFTSWADNLVPNDTNLIKDVFEKDLVTGQTIRVNVSSSGDQAIGFADNFSSDGGRPSADGRYVAFHSSAENLVVPDLNPGTTGTDVYVHDRATGQTTLESVSAAGVQGVTVLSFGYPDISPDGSVLAFTSDAANLVPGDTNGGQDVFVRNRSTGKITRVSVSSAGEQARCGLTTCPGGGGPSSNLPNSNGAALTVNPSGVYVAYNSNATNLVAGDTNGLPDVFRTTCTVCL